MRVALSVEQVDLLLRFERLLRARALPLGLVAKGDAHNIRSRHTLDSLRAAAAMEGAADAYDLGSGAGLPGIVVAITCPNIRVGLVDSRRKRVAFLELAVEKLGLPNAVPLGVRAETIREPVDVCLARGFAPLAGTWNVAKRLLRSGGRLVYFAGATGEATRGLQERGAGGSRAKPTDARVLRVLDNPVLASAGPLVIMARQ